MFLFVVSFKVSTGLAAFSAGIYVNPFDLNTNPAVRRLNLDPSAGSMDSHRVKPLSRLSKTYAIVSVPV